MDEAWNEGKETWEAYLARIKDIFAEKAAAAAVKRGQAPGRTLLRPQRRRRYARS